MFNVRSKTGSQDDGHFLEPRRKNAVCTKNMLFGMFSQHSEHLGGSLPSATITAASNNRLVRFFPHFSATRDATQCPKVPQRRSKGSQSTQNQTGNQSGCQGGPRGAGGTVPRELRIFQKSMKTFFFQSAPLRKNHHGNTLIITSMHAHAFPD